MSIQQSIADKETGEISEAITSRIRRGIEHFEAFASGIERVGEGVYLVPSSTGASLGKYRVEISLTEDGTDHCNCVDFAHNGVKLRCDKHTISALIAEAKYQAAKRRAECYDAVDFHYSCLEEEPTATYGLELGPVYDHGEAIVSVFEYQGESKRLITTTGSMYAAEKDVAALRNGTERGRRLLGNLAKLRARELEGVA